MCVCQMAASSTGDSLETLSAVAAAAEPVREAADAKPVRAKRTLTAKTKAAPAKRARTQSSHPITEVALHNDWNGVCAVGTCVAVASTGQMAYKFPDIEDFGIPVATSTLNDAVDHANKVLEAKYAVENVHTPETSKVATSLVHSDGRTVIRGLPTGMRVRTGQTFADVLLPGDATPIAIAATPGAILVASKDTLFCFHGHAPHELQRKPAVMQGIVAIAAEDQSVYVLIKTCLLFKINATSFVIEWQRQLREAPYMGIAVGGGKLFFAVATGVVCVDQETWTSPFIVAAPGLRAISASKSMLAVLSADCLRTCPL